MNDNEVAKAALAIKEILIVRSHMKPKDLKELLLSEIDSVSNRSDDFSFDSGKHFTRKRKLPFEKVIKTIIGMEN